VAPGVTHPPRPHLLLLQQTLLHLIPGHGHCHSDAESSCCAGALHSFPALDVEPHQQMGRLLWQPCCLTHQLWLEVLHQGGEARSVT
jgi:hypothetical protein